MPQNLDLNLPEEEWNLGLAKDMCEAVIAAITTEASQKAHNSLSAGEKLLLKELLEMISAK